jgi:hypothetical protein
MTKKDMAKAIAQDMGLPQAQELVQRVFDGITETLVREGRVERRNFGVFQVKQPPHRWPCDGPTKACGQLYAGKGNGGTGRPVEGRAEQKAVISAATPTRDNLAVPDDDDTFDSGPLACGFPIAVVLFYPDGASDDDVAVADLGLVHGVSLIGRGPSGFKQKCTDGHATYQQATGSEDSPGSGISLRRQ